MSVFETLYLLYKADTTDLKRGSEEVNQSTKKLDGSLRNVNKTLEHMGHKFGEIAIEFGSMIAAFASLHAILSGIEKTISYDINIGDQSEITQISPENFDAWSNAVVQAGGTTEEFGQSIRSLAENFHTTGKVALQALPQIADAFSKISHFAAFNWGKAMGLSDHTILLLLKGRKEIEDIIKRQKELGVVSKKDAESINEFDNETKNLSHSLRTLFNAVFVPMIPSLVKFFHVLEDGFIYLANHRDVVVGALVGIGAAAIAAAFAFTPLTLEAILLGGEVLILIALFALLWDDLQTYFKGGQSLIGEYLQEWKDLGKEVDDILARWTDKFLDFLSKFKLLKPLIDDIRNEDSSLFATASHKKGAHLLGLKKHDQIQVAKSLINNSSQHPLNNKQSLGQFYSSSYNKNFTINSMPIEIITQATDAVGIASSISLTWPDHLKHANNFFADGNEYG